jgi:uncharacterized protein (TIGR01777 family)
MRIVISGGSGFLGQLLSATLVSEGADVVILTRTPFTPTAAGSRVRRVTWIPDGSTGPWAAEIDGAEGVVNLAGESIANRRWTAPQRARIRDSRILATRSIVSAVAKAAQPPAVLVSGSAVGYYGPRGDELITEDTPPGDDFLAQVAAAWETEALRASSSTRVVCVRTGIVLHKKGGALPRMLLPFWLGVGGPIGSGRQYWPWIHWRDWVGLVRFALRTSSASGALNATAPNPVTNREFVRALGRAMHRPALVPTPGLALRFMLGEMADALLLSGQRVVPGKAERLGFTFGYENIDAAFADVLK